MGWQYWLPLPGSAGCGRGDSRGLLPLVLDLQLPQREAEEAHGHGADAREERRDRPGGVDLFRCVLELYPRFEDDEAGGRCVRSEGHVSTGSRPRDRGGRVAGEFIRENFCIYLRRYDTQQEK